MSSGSVTAHVILDKPNYVHCGSDDPVTGNVRLLYQPSREMARNAELFGPLRVTLRFCGRAKTKIKRDDTWDRGRAPLFAVAHLVYDGPVRIAAGAPHPVPFAIHFPETVQTPSFPAFEPHDSRFNVNPDQPLPPTSRVHYNGFASKTFEAFVEYQLFGSVALPGINVTVHNPRDAEGPRVMYERARLPAPPVDPRPPRLVRGMLRAQNKLLLPETDRPHGFKEKAKAAFSSTYYPVAVFSWTCYAPTQVCRGQAIPLTVRAWPRVEDCTAPTVPEIRLLRCAVKITAHTCVRSDIHILHCHDAAAHVSLESWCTRTPPAGGDATATPFCEADGWAKTFNSVVVKQSPSTFKTVNIAQFYQMQISLTFALPGETKEFKHVLPITIHPPVRLQQALTQSQSQLGVGGLPSNSGVMRTNEDPSLPAYDEASKPPPKYTAAPAYPG